MIDGRVDCAVLRFGVAPEMGKERVLAVIPRPAATFHKVHSTVRDRSETEMSLAVLNIIIVLSAIGQHHHGVQRHRLAFTSRAAENPIDRCTYRGPANSIKRSADEIGNPGAGGSPGGVLFEHDPGPTV